MAHSGGATSYRWATRQQRRVAIPVGSGWEVRRVSGRHSLGLLSRACARHNPHHHLESGPRAKEPVRNPVATDTVEGETSSDEDQRVVKNTGPRVNKTAVVVATGRCLLDYATGKASQRGGS